MNASGLHQGQIVFTFSVCLVSFTVTAVLFADGRGPQINEWSLCCQRRHCCHYHRYDRIDKLLRLIFANWTMNTIWTKEEFCFTDMAGS